MAGLSWLIMSGLIIDKHMICCRSDFCDKTLIVTRPSLVIVLRGVIISKDHYFNNHYFNSLLIEYFWSGEIKHSVGCREIYFKKYNNLCM